MEVFVRPYETVLPYSTKRLVASNTKKSVSYAMATFGAAGAVPVPQEFAPPLPGGVDFNVVDCDHKYDETRRKTSDVRVTNPDDDSQYVIVQRIDEIHFNLLDPNNNQLTITGSTTQTALWSAIKIVTTCDTAHGSPTILNIGDVTGLIEGQKYAIQGTAIAPSGVEWTFNGGTTGTLDVNASDDSTAGEITIASIGSADFLLGSEPVSVVTDTNALCDNGFKLHNK